MAILWIGAVGPRSIGDLLAGRSRTVSPASNSRDCSFDRQGGLMLTSACFGEHTLLQTSFPSCSTLTCRLFSLCDVAADHSIHVTSRAYLYTHRN